MKKLIVKDKKLRYQFKLIENKHFILKCIFKNLNFFTLIRWNCFLKLDFLIKNKSKISIINKCLQGLNKKRLNKITVLSRHIFLKLIRSGLISGIQKAS